MAPSIVPGSISIKIFSYPQVAKPVVPFTGSPINKGRAPGPVFAGFQCAQGISLAAEVLLRGDDADMSGCTLGFMQMQWVETCWFYYRGKVSQHGSMLVQAGRPPARSQQVCRDCIDAGASSTWVNQEDNGQPIKISENLFKAGCTLDDSPLQAVLLGEKNGLTGQTNLLSAAQVERQFCAILTLQDGDGVMHQLASRYWNVHWQANFQPTVFDQPFTRPWRITPVAKGNSSAVGGLILGPPTDARFAPQVFDSETPICNDLLQRAGAVVDDFNPDGTVNTSFDKRNRRESLVWHQFDVRI